MNDYVRHLMEMFEGVEQFGKKPELDLTPKLTGLFGQVTTRLTAMRAFAAGQTGGNGDFREHSTERFFLSRGIFTTLRDMEEIAKGMEVDGDAGILDQFRLPKSRAYQSILAAARSFVTNATPLSAAFIERGMPATFIADLEAQITAFDTATSGKSEGKGDRVGSTAILTIHGREGLKAVQQLRGSMRVLLRNSPDLLAAWNSISRVQRALPKEPQTPPEPTPTGTEIVI